MEINYYFHPTAEAELFDYIDYYEQQAQGLGSKVIVELELTLRQIETFPFSYQQNHALGVHLAPLHHFPLSVIYRIKNNSVQILAIAHQQRQPNYWGNRTL
ncbi:type II toxin-antitoxin system RelE/ParE family toxin [Maribrevibacterium harenarium]|uniref:Type II toxin-antitoxin system RelE/ParE family toxin n=1 Tax=Maribrevibacterium harenarium TaxID=2589817 RepID=A0A501X196_9GAMM|nr:type II toxin-antitoxin system RelE/ParE family toxin [Maribrevibacterium harenarium]